jgi:sugar phosphate isomerase/epimerase
MLKLGAGAAAMCALPAHLLGAEGTMSKKIPIGLQLYSVRKECEKDLPAVLEAVAKMGYKGVEFAGYYGRNANQLRTLLDANGLVCCGTHTGLDTLNERNVKATIEFHKILGNKFLIVPGLPSEREATAQACKDTGKLFTELGEKVKADGMRVGYHAHGGDFKKFGEETAWELIFSSAGPDVVMQLDVGNCLDGNGDPYAMLRKFPGRSGTIHLKEHGGKAEAPVGEGDVKWDEVFKLCETTGKTEWYIVEHESGSKPLDSVKACLDNLRKMGKC